MQLTQTVKNGVWAVLFVALVWAIAVVPGQYLTGEYSVSVQRQTKFSPNQALQESSTLSHQRSVIARPLPPAQQPSVIRPSSSTAIPLSPPRSYSGDIKKTIEPKFLVVTPVITVMRTQKEEVASVASSPYRLAVAKAGDGKGKIISTSDQSIECGILCTAAYPKGTTVTLTVQPDYGSVFTAWYGSCTGQRLPCVIRVDSVKSVTAVFSRARTHRN